MVDWRNMKRGADNGTDSLFLSVVVSHRWQSAKYGGVIPVPFWRRLPLEIEQHGVLFNQAKEASAPAIGKGQVPPQGCLTLYVPGLPGLGATSDQLAACTLETLPFVLPGWRDFLFFRAASSWTRPGS